MEKVSDEQYCELEADSASQQFATFTRSTRSESVVRSMCALLASDLEDLSATKLLLLEWYRVGLIDVPFRNTFPVLGEEFRLLERYEMSSAVELVPIE